tara:strand:+ start:944 stop:1270 length:327 start_codon:yes stop_codon:yes gene_type:complete
MKPLKGSKNVEDLFSSGKRTSSLFLHCVYVLDELSETNYVVSVPKKSFPLAVRRNKIKRILREVLKKNKKKLIGFGGGRFMFIYSCDRVLSFSEINNDLVLILKQIRP